MTAAAEREMMVMRTAGAMVRGAMRQSLSNGTVSGTLTTPEGALRDALAKARGLRLSRELALRDDPQAAARKRGRSARAAC